MRTAENNIKNKVYCAEGDPDYGCIFIAAKTSKEAKYIAIGSWVAAVSYTHLRAHET